MSDRLPSSLEDLRKRVNDTFAEQDIEWASPIPLDEPDRPAFPTRVLPHEIRAMVEAVAEDTQTPEDLAAIMALGAISASVVGRYVVEVRPGFEEPCHTQTYCELGSGNRKSAVTRKVIQPIHDWERARAADDRIELAKFKSASRIRDLQLKKLESQSANPPPPGKPEIKDLGLQIDALNKEIANDREPAITQRIYDDVTPEKLVQEMAQQGGAAAIISAEGGYFSNLPRYAEGNAASAVQPVLKGHAGDQFPVHRMGRAAHIIPRACLSLAVSLQRAVILELGQMKGVKDRGVAARLLPSHPLSPVGSRRTSAETTPVPADVSGDWSSMITTLLNRPSVLDDEGYLVPEVVRLSKGAREQHSRFEKEIEPRLGPYGDLSHIEGWGSKVVGAAARIAGLLHLAQNAGSSSVTAISVSEDTMLAAIEIAHYHIAHAKVFAQLIGEHSDASAAASVLEMIQEMGDDISVRDLFQKLRKRREFPTVASLNAPLEVLEDMGYIRIQGGKATGGRPASKRIRLNPLAAGAGGSSAPPIRDEVRAEALNMAAELIQSGEAAIDEWHRDVEARRAELSPEDYSAALLALNIARGVAA